MAISTQDLTKGIDFTGLGTTATASQHNQLIEQGVPTPDASADVGRGLTITTTDSAVGTPVVPDAATNTKWQRYLWVRRPHASDTARTVKIYAWDTGGTSVATYLKWSVSTVDLTTLEAEIATAQSTATTALAGANAAQSTANTANTAAAAATASATAANNAAAAAQTSANTASSAATTANSNASAALTASAAAVAAASAPVNQTRISGFSTAFQHLRSNQSAAAAEWFDPRNELVMITNATSQTIVATPQQTATSNVFTNVIPLITVVSTGALCTVTSVTYIMTFSPGIYKCMLAFRFNSSLGGTGANSPYIVSYYIALQKISDSSIALTTQLFQTNFTTGAAAATQSFITQIVLNGLLIIPISAASTTYRLILVLNTASNGIVLPSTFIGSAVAEPLYFEATRISQTP